MFEDFIEWGDKRNKINSLSHLSFGNYRQPTSQPDTRISFSMNFC